MLFKEIQGNNDIKRHLIQIANDKKISHAILFNGHEGSAKLQLALSFATYIHCEHKENGDACGKCPSCVQMAKLSHPDLHFIFPVGNSKLRKVKEPVSDDFMTEWIDYVNEYKALGNLYEWTSALKIESGQAIINVNECNGIIKKLSYTSYESKYKIMIIWMVENLFHAAAPKLLKSLEEPPDNTLFLIITENKELILDTILSRLQIVNIQNFTGEDVKNILTNDFQAELTDAIRIANNSDGNAFLAIKDAFNPDENKSHFNLFVKWMRICLKANPLEMLPFVEEISNGSKESCVLFLKNALNFLHNSLNYNLAGIEIPFDDKEQEETFIKFSKFVTQANIQIFDSNIESAISNIRRNGYINLILINLTITLCRAFKTK